MIDHAKAAAATIAVALSVQVPPLVAAILTWLRSTQAVLVIVGVLWGVGAWVFGLWFRDQRNKERSDAAAAEKEREAARKAEEDAREARVMAAIREVESRFKEQIRDLEAEQRRLNDIFQKVLNRGEVLGDQVKSAAEEVKRAHARLDIGQTAFSELRERVAVVAARQSRRATRDESDG